MSRNKKILLYIVNILLPGAGFILIGKYFPGILWLALAFIIPSTKELNNLGLQMNVAFLISVSIRIILVIIITLHLRKYLEAQNR